MKTAIFTILFCLFPAVSYALMVKTQYSAHALSGGEGSVDMYKYSVDKENCDAGVSEPWDAHQELSSVGVEVVSIHKGMDNLPYTVEHWDCSEDPHHINIVTIHNTEQNIATAQSLGFQLCTELEEQGGKCHAVSFSALTEPADIIAEYEKREDSHVVSVYKNSGSKQCEPNSGMDVDSMEIELTDAQIVVYQRYKAVDGRIYPLVCGGSQGDINVYVVEKSALGKVHQLGFRECAYLRVIGGACQPLF